MTFLRYDNDTYSHALVDASSGLADVSANRLRLYPQGRVEGQFRHQVDEGCEKALGGLRVVTVRLQARDKSGLVIDALSRLLHVLPCLGQLLGE